jgi:hypothetical protein
MNERIRQGIAHLPRRAIRQETHRIDRFTSRASSDKDFHAGKVSNPACLGKCG